MSESAVGPAARAKAKARVDVEVILGSILLGVCAAALATLAAWLLGARTPVRAGGYVGLGVVVFMVGVHIWRVWLQRIGKLPSERASPNLSPPAHGPRNHVICLDGTWNLPDVPTNVRKLFERLVQEPEKQIARYYPGVGIRELVSARSDFVKRYLSKTLFEGATGYGSSGVLSILRQAYFDLVKFYRPEDRLYIFGFSRGAATARALANYLCKTHGLPEAVEITHLKSRIQKDVVTDLEVTGRLRSGAPKVVFLGLWDTVASMGNPYDKRESVDLTIPAGVETVLHLVAIDEQRQEFDVVLIDRDDRVEEVWFPGAHSNVGGGHADSTLSDIALRFMARRAEALGVLFKEPASVIRADLANATPAALWKPGPLWKLKMTRKVRVQDRRSEGVPRIHESVFRLRNAGIEYNPSNIPARYVSEDAD